MLVLFPEQHFNWLWRHTTNKNRRHKQACKHEKQNKKRQRVYLNTRWLMYNKNVIRCVTWLRRVVTTGTPPVTPQIRTSAIFWVNFTAIPSSPTFELQWIAMGCMECLFASLFVLPDGLQFYLSQHLQRSQITSHLFWVLDTYEEKHEKMLNFGQNVQNFLVTRTRAPKPVMEFYCHVPLIPQPYSKLTISRSRRQSRLRKRSSAGMCRSWCLQTMQWLEKHIGRGHKLN